MTENHNTINVLIVEDEVLIAKDISNHLQRLGYEIAGIAYNSDKALDLMHNREFNFAILDVNIGGTRDGIEIGEILNEKYNVPFIYLTSYSDKNTLDKAKKTFPYGYIVKPFDENDLKSTIEMAIYRYENEHKSLMPPLERINEYYEISLSEREYEVIQAIINGSNNSEISQQFFLSENTIKTHIKRIYQKLSVNNRAGMTRKILILKELK